MFGTGKFIFSKLYKGRPISMRIGCIVQKNEKLQIQPSPTKLPSNNNNNNNKRLTFCLNSTPVQSDKNCIPMFGVPLEQSRRYFYYKTILNSSFAYACDDIRLDVCNAFLTFFRKFCTYMSLFGDITVNIIIVRSRNSSPMTRYTKKSRRFLAFKRYHVIGGS